MFWTTIISNTNDYTFTGVYVPSENTLNMNFNIFMMSWSSFFSIVYKLFLHVVVYNGDLRLV